MHGLELAKERYIAVDQVLHSIVLGPSKISLTHDYRLPFKIFQPRDFNLNLVCCCYGFCRGWSLCGSWLGISFGKGESLLRRDLIFPF
jgi:hypothetical protein